MTLRKEKERQFREDLIIEITEKLFMENGVSETTMDDIAKNCDLSKTTLYKSFKSKDELEILVYQKIHASKMEFLKAEIEKTKGPYEKLMAFGKAYYRFYLKNPHHLQFQLKHDYIGINKNNVRVEIQENMYTFFEKDIKYMNEVYNQGVKQGILRGGIDPADVLDIFYITLRAVLNQSLLFNPNTSFEGMYSKPEKKYHLFLEIFLDGLKIDNDN
jgi:AcrR family transcriptional regulator